MMAAAGSWEPYTRDLIKPLEGEMLLITLRVCQMLTGFGSELQTIGPVLQGFY